MAYRLKKIPKTSTYQLTSKLIYAYPKNLVAIFLKTIHAHLICKSSLLMDRIPLLGTLQFFKPSDQTGNHHLNL